MFHGKFLGFPFYISLAHRLLDRAVVLSQLVFSAFITQGFIMSTVFNLLLRLEDSPFLAEISEVFLR